MLFCYPITYHLIHAYGGKFWIARVEICHFEAELTQFKFVRVKPQKITAPVYLCMELAMRGLPCVRLRLPPLDTHAYKTSRSFQTGARSAIFLSKSKPKMSIDISKSSTDDLVKILQEKEVAQEAVSAVIGEYMCTMRKV